MTRLLNFLANGFVAFIPALLVAWMANVNILVAAEMSVAFALTGLAFSTSYMGLRSYISINGFVTGTYYGDVMFRCIMVFVASIFCYIFSLIGHYSLVFVFLAISVKLSEAYIDLKVGIETYRKGVGAASKEYFVLAAVRAFVLVFSCFLVFEMNSLQFEKYYTTVCFVIGILFWILFFQVGEPRFEYDWTNYLSAIFRLRYFALATFSCSLLSVSPRLVLDSDAVSSRIILIAFSIAPVIAIGFQSIWQAAIVRLRSGCLKRYFLFFLEVFFLVFLVYIFSPVWRFIAEYCYGIDNEMEVDLFSDSILAMSFLFFAMTLMNTFKYSIPFMEFVAYVLCAMIIISSVLLFDIHIFHSLAVSSAIMVLFFIFNMLIIQKTMKNAE